MQKIYRLAGYAHVSHRRCFVIYSSGLKNCWNCHDLWNHSLGKQCSNDWRICWLLCTGFDDILWLGWISCKHWCFCSLLSCCQSLLGLMSLWVMLCCKSEAVEDLGFEDWSCFDVVLMQRFKWNIDIKQPYLLTVFHGIEYSGHCSAILNVSNQFVIRMEFMFEDTSYCFS